jgi:hypothetical protein
LGGVVFVSAVTCLLLSLQWGGTEYNWSNVHVIALITTFALLIALFIYLELQKGDLAMLPPKIFRERTLALASLFGFCSASALSIIDIYVGFVPLLLAHRPDIADY